MEYEKEKSVFQEKLTAGLKMRMTAEFDDKKTSLEAELKATFDREVTVLQENFAKERKELMLACNSQKHHLKVEFKSL